MMKSENLVIEKNMGSLKPFDVERISKEYRVDEDKLLGGEDFIKDLFCLFLERVFINDSVPLGVLMNTVERSIIIRALSIANGCQKEAAKILGVKYTTLNEKVKKYEIQLKKSFY